MSDFFDLDKLSLNSGKPCLLGSFNTPENIGSTADRHLDAHIFHVGLDSQSKFRYAGVAAFSGASAGASVEASGSSNTSAPPANVSGRKPGAGGTNASVVWNTLTQTHGFTAEAAAGVIGNLMQESGIQPTSHQKGGPGRGIMQWTQSQRWQELLAWAGKQSRDPWALDTQIDFMIHEMKTRRSGGQSIYDKLKTMRSVNEATYFFEITMEAAGRPMMSKRYGYAAEAYKAFAGGSN